DCRTDTCQHVGQWYSAAAPAPRACRPGLCDTKPSETDKKRFIRDQEKELMSMAKKWVCAAVASLAMTGAAWGAGGVVISQIYGGGGGSNAPYNQDYIELFNQGSTPVTMTNWSVQYQTQGNSTWSLVGVLNTTLQPGQYYLVSASTVGAT